MKNSKSFLYAVIFCIAAVYLSNIFQILTATIITDSYEYNLKPFNPEFLLTAQSSSIEKIMCYSAPFIFLIFIIEYSKFNLQKLEVGIKRFTYMLVIIFLLGYLIINLFFSAFGLILANTGGDFVNLANSLDFSFEGRIIFIFFVLILFFGYLKQTAKFLSNYLQSQR